MRFDEIIRARGPLIIVDTETGGLDPQRHSLLSVAFVSIDGARRVELFVREPSLVTNPESMKVNGIDLEMIEREGLSPQEACERLDRFLEGELERAGGKGALLIGHNVAFDLAFLKRLYRLAGREGDHPLISHRSLDTHTLLWALAALGQIPAAACGSDGAFKHYGVSPPEELRHTALGDAVATQELLVKLMTELSEALRSEA